MGYGNSSGYHLVYAGQPLFSSGLWIVLIGLKWTQCLVYMDDILVLGKDFQQHLNRLDTVLQALEQAGLTLNFKKCLFATRKVDFLGFTVTQEGLSPNHKKVEAIMRFPRPTTLTQLRAFLGMNTENLYETPPKILLL